MCDYNRMTLQRYISAAYRNSNHYVPGAVKKLDAMIDLLESLDPTDDDELTVGALAVIEEFAIDPSAA